MQVMTERFGSIVIDDSDVVELPEAIPGFPELRRVTLLGAGALPGHEPVDDVHAMFWMQSVDDGSLAFLCIQPWIAFPDYDFQFDAESLGIADPDNVCVLNMVTVRREGGAAVMTANLRAPLVIDLERRVMFQVILTDGRWVVNAPFATTIGGSV